MDKSIFSQNLVKARKEKGWSQEGAAKEIGVKRSVLGSYEEDRAEPPHDTLQKICKAYGIHDLNSFMSNPSYFEIRITAEEIFMLYKKLPWYKRNAVNSILGIDY